MTETQRGTGTDYPQVVRSGEGQPTGWVGWIFFAGIMMIILGGLQAIAGLVAIFDDGYYAVTNNGLVVHANYTAWGWTHLGLGVLAVVAGFGVMVGNVAARIYGIILASVSILVNMAFMAAYPVWGVIIIAVDVLIIYALAVHGREVKNV